MEENSEDKFISTLKEKINSAKAPYRNILLSILAHTYEQYYKENLYGIYKRSYLEDSSSTSDYKVWDDRRFQKEITRLYLSSIGNSEMLSNTAVKDFSEIIKYEFGNLTITKATLLDMLGLSALNYFMDSSTNSEYSVSKEMDEFNMEDSSYLSGAKEFVKLRPVTTDTLSLKYRAFKLFQLLMSYHMNRPNDKNSTDDINTSKLLAEIDVMRMKFIYENRGNKNYDSLLIKTLRKSALSSPGGPVSMVYWLKLAEYYVKFSNDSDSPETKKFNANAAAICDSLLKKEDKSSESIEIKNLLKRLKKKIQERYLNFTLQSTSAADKAFGALFEYRNIDTVFISIIPMSSTNKKVINDEWEKMDSSYSKLNGVISFSRILKNDKDYMTHSVELALPPLKPGPYTLLVSDSKEYKSNTIAHKEFEISNLALLTRENHEKVELMVTNRLTGRPEKDVNINIYVDWYDLKSGKDTMRLDSKLVTDENGLAMFSGYTRVYELLLLKGGDTLRVNDFLSSGSSMVDTGTAERTYIFTDRAIYRPGQKIFFKGIISQLNMKQRTSKAVNEKDVCVTLFDANSQVIKQTNMKTNEFGAFSGEFDLPAGRLNGRWRISAGGSTQYFRVEEYKRPQFEVILDPQKENISINDTVIIKGKAVTYSGAPLTNASVKYKVNRSSGHYFWYPYSSESKEDKTIAEGKISTDSLGCFSFKFVTIGKEKKEQEDIIYRYSCSVSVTDATGETHGAENEISVSRYDLFLNADIPDVINSEENKSIKISAVNIEDEPLKAGVKTAVYRLNVPKEVLVERPWGKPDGSKSDPENWQVLADGEIYEDEYPLESWTKAETVFQKQIEIMGDSSIALIGSSDWKPGKYLIVLSAMGKKGEARFEKYFDVFSPSADLIPVNKPLWAAVITPKVKPGSYIKIAAGTGLKEANVLYEVEDKSGILLRKWITLNKGQRVLDFPVDKAEKDDLIVRMTAVYENQRYSFAERIRLQNPEMKLNITLESFRNKIKPGSKEEWRLKIKMPDGSPSKAELLASMYDMSLDALYLHSWEFTPFALSNTKMVEWERDEAFNLTETDHLYLRSDYFNVIDYNFPKIYLFGFSLSGDYRPGNILKSRKYQLKELKRLRFLPPVIKYDEQVTDEYIPTVEELYNVAPDSKNSEGQAGGVDYSLIEVTEAPKKDEIVKEEVMNKESGGKNYLNNKEVGVR
ncbi:MAG: MG2 domain-containing protein, partial [Bacteroidota bacterium]|nr:MG2 domain-containing protein [Bacteroidota bacterium]